MPAASDEELSRALVLYFGWRISPAPFSDSTRVLAEFGEQRGEELVVELRSFIRGELDHIQVDPIIRGELDHIQANPFLRDLVARAAFVRNAASQIRPGLSESALDAIEWAYAFTNR